MRIGSCQLESTSGDFDGNLKKVEAGLERAADERLEIVCFPECYLTGYQDSEEVTRKHAFSVGSPSFMRVLSATAQCPVTAIIGFNEARGEKLFNSAMIVQQGHLLGIYSKCSAYQPFHTQGREFPVFTREIRRGPHAGKTVTFGVVVCSDGGFIEPSRILAVKGARVIFSPHYNSIPGPGLIGHFMKVRADHVARAVENSVYFLRSNSVTLGRDTGLTKFEGVGYGDSYLVDPHGEIVVRSQRHVEDFFFADIDPFADAFNDYGWGVGRSLYSAREYGPYLQSALKEVLK